MVADAQFLKAFVPTFNNTSRAERKRKRLIKDLLDRGFSKDQKVEQANLEDVFIDLTGKELHNDV